jgi:hypothetical protein
MVKCEVAKRTLKLYSWVPSLLQVYSSLKPRVGLTAESGFIALVKDGPADEAWALVQKRLVVEFAFKVGKVPSIFLLMKCESEDAVRSHIEKLPSVRDGWVDYQIDPISAVAKFD